MRNRLYRLWTSSITRQLMIGIALVHAVLMSIFVFDLVGREREFMLNQNNEGALGLAHTLAANGSSWILASDFVGIEEVIESQNSFPELVYAMFIDMDGKVLGFTDRSKVGQYLNDSVSLQLLQADSSKQILVNTPQFIDLAVPVTASSRQIGWARIRLDRTNISDNLQIITIKGLLYTGFAITIGLVFAWIMAKGMTYDLRILEEKANQVFEGKPDVNFRLGRSDEIGKLSIHFDTMVKKREGVLSLTHQKLVDSEERLQLALDGANDGLWDWNIQTNEVYYSPRYKSMLGYENHEFSNSYDGWEKHVHPEDLLRIKEEIKAVILGEKSALESVVRVQHKDGNYLWILNRGKIISDVDGRVTRMVGTHVDITEQKEQEELIIKLNKQREQSKHIESLKTIAEAMAHRFNNAMMVVQGNLHLLLSSLAEKSEEHQMASDAAQAAKGATQVGTMMLSYVGQQSAHLQKIVFADFVEETVITFEKNLLSPVSIQFTPPDKQFYCSIDRVQIQAVIESLLANAVESLEENSGTIEITFGIDFFTSNSLPVSFQNDDITDGNYLFCQIKDTGHGIKPEDLLRIFEPFYTTRFVGRGLGLAMTVGIMITHKGAITVESSPNKGTSVKVLLPVIG